MAVDVTLFEVGPRDGLQNEKEFVATTEKVALVNVSTKETVTRLKSLGLETGLDFDALAEAAEMARTLTGQ